MYVHVGVWRPEITIGYLLKFISTFCFEARSFNEPSTSAILTSQQALECHLFISLQSGNCRKGLLCPVYIGVGNWLLVLLLDRQAL